MPEYLIDDPNDPRLTPYRQLRHHKLPRCSGLFIAEGRFVVERLLASDFAVDSVLATDRRRRTIAPLLPPETVLYVVPHEVAEQLVGYSFHAGVLACGRRRANLTLEELLANAGQQLTLVVCPHLLDPENLGGIVRLCAAFETDGLLLGPSCTDPFSRRVLRVSMGNAFRLPIVESPDLLADLQQLRQRWGVQCAAAALDQQGEPLDKAARPKKLALLFGHEADGLSQELLELCERRLVIPMAPGVDSLNVAHATAIFLHHFMRVTPS